MRDLSSISKELEKLKSYLSDNPSIIAFYLFGSYGTEYQNQNSDIDFAVLYNKNVLLEEELTLEVKISEIFKKR